MTNPIEYLRGVGPQRAELLKKELSIFCFADLLLHFPYRHIDKSEIRPISSIRPDTDFIQVRGTLSHIGLAGEKRHARRLTATLRDSSGELELVWFQGASWIQKVLHAGGHYLVYGRVSFFNGVAQISHPEMDLLGNEQGPTRPALEPVYPSTEKLRARGLGGRALGKLTRVLLDLLGPSDLPENLPLSVLGKFKLIPRHQALFQIHFPASAREFVQAERRLKFEELFLSQVRICRLKIRRQQTSRGLLFTRVGDNFNRFYSDYLPFALTGAQKKVLREIRTDTASGKQMNRLIQGDVGSGKTIVALLAMLLAVDNGFQACLMAPTEVLARQHLRSITTLLGDMPVTVELLTGQVKGKARKKVLEGMASGQTNLLVGTHALVEAQATFSNLGLAIVDEQHRFGVAQRAGLWSKNEIPPHILVMTATPIPRTLAMTLYGDLDVSVIDELPAGRKPVRTIQRKEGKRHQVMAFLRDQIKEGRQAYIVYPLIEESEKSDYENLMKGFEEVKAYFPEPDFLISMVHGRQPSDQRMTNMDRFVRGNTQIMVATTVIEVGVDVANASVMVVESAERFGLSQLHQLRGRVGRGSEQSYCVLMTSLNPSAEAMARIGVMEETTDGFLIAEKDLELRGPGDIEGTRQSGILDFRLADIGKDKAMLDAARKAALQILESDPELSSVPNQGLLNYLGSRKSKTVWSKIS